MYSRRNWSPFSLFKYIPKALALSTQLRPYFVKLTNTPSLITMVVKVYGHPMTACTQRVTHICKEANIPYEFIPVDLVNGAHKTDDYNSKAPFGLVPYIEDDGFVMYESRAIARYLAQKAGRFIPKAGADLQETARFEQAMSIEATNFDPYAFGLVREIILGPTHFNMAVDEVNVKRLTDLLELRLAGHERILARHRYLAGDEVSLADFFHLPFGFMLLDLGIPFFEDANKFPNVARWWQDVSSSQAFQEVRSERNGWVFNQSC